MTTNSAHELMIPMTVTVLYTYIRGSLGVSWYHYN